MVAQVEKANQSAGRKLFQYEQTSDPSHDKRVYDLKKKKPDAS